MAEFIANTFDDDCSRALRIAKDIMARHEEKDDEQIIQAAILVELVTLNSVLQPD